MQEEFDKLTKEYDKCIENGEKKTSYIYFSYGEKILEKHYFANICATKYLAQVKMLIKSHESKK